MSFVDFLNKGFKQYEAGAFLKMKTDNELSKYILNHTVMFFNYINHEETRQVLFDNFTTMSPIYIADTDSKYIVFQNNSFDSNVGLHGGAIQIDHAKVANSSTSINEAAPFVMFKNNQFTRNIAYLEGTAIYIGGG